MKTKNIKLIEPVTVGGKEITEITVRRSTIGDEEDAMQAAIQMKRGKNPLCVEMNLMSRVSKLPYDVLRSMHGQDYQQIRNALNEVNGTLPEAVDDENPMTPAIE